MKLNRLWAGGVAGLAVIAAAACSPDGPTGPVDGPGFLVTEGQTALLQICKSPFDPPGTDPEVSGVVGEEFTFDVYVNGNLYTTIVEEAVSFSDCLNEQATVNITAPAGGIQTITVVERAEAGFALASVVPTSGGSCPTFADGAAAPDLTAQSITVDVTSCSAGSIGRLAFKNITVETPPPPPPPGDEGCTPGYWKQSQHFDSWPVDPATTTFSGVFGVGPNVTLLTALGTGGGGESALGRHASAAYLNSFAVNYPYTPAEVIAAVQAAYASGDFETAKNLFADSNELGCPLN